MESAIYLISAIAILYGGWYVINKLEGEYKKVQLTVIIEKSGSGYTAHCKEIDGIIAEGENIPALKDQFHEAFMIMLNYQDDMNGQYANMYPSDFEFTYVEE